MVYTINQTILGATLMAFWTSLVNTICAYRLFFWQGFYNGLAKTTTSARCATFCFNLVFNAAFTPLQFGLKNNILATLDILFVLGTIIWAIIAIYPHVRWVAFLQIPYLLWVSFATILQITITYLNK
jgi:tryptophan-rich sensory protein